MAIEFACPDCGKGFSVKDELAGKRGKCSACGQSFRVPSPDDFEEFGTESDPIEVLLAGEGRADDGKAGPATRIGPATALDRRVAGLGHGLSPALGVVGRTLAGLERLALRLALYAMILHGLAASSPDPIGRLPLLLGVCTLAVVAWVSPPPASRGPGGR